MFTSIWTSIQDFGVCRTICTIAIGALFVWIFVPKNKGGKGNNSGSGTTPPAQG